MCPFITTEVYCTSKSAKLNQHHLKQFPHKLDSISVRVGLFAGLLN